MRRTVEQVKYLYTCHEEKKTGCWSFISKDGMMTDGRAFERRSPPKLS
jgi:hypothetical protein